MLGNFLLLACTKLIDFNFEPLSVNLKFGQFFGIDKSTSEISSPGFGDFGLPEKYLLELLELLEMSNPFVGNLRAIEVQIFKIR